MLYDGTKDELIQYIRFLWGALSFARSEMRLQEFNSIDDLLKYHAEQMNYEGKQFR